MDIALKYRLIEKIINSKNDILLDEVNLLLGFSEDGFWDDLPAEVQQAINNAKLELDVARAFLTQK